MTSTCKKGQKKEYEIRKRLQKEGWVIMFKSVRFRFGCIDLCGLFDVSAYKGKDRLFISAKHFTKGDYHLPHQAEIKKFKEEYGYPGEKYQLWLWKKPQWNGRGVNKKWCNGEFIILDL
jgi:Holliday junction resolvase-like predicted endonuclease